MGEGQLLKWLYDQGPVGGLYAVGLIVFVVWARRNGFNVVGLLKEVIGKGNAGVKGENGETTKTNVLRHHEAETLLRDHADRFRESIDHLEETTTDGLGEIRDEVRKIDGSVVKISDRQERLDKRVDDAEGEIKGHDRQIVKLETFREAAEKEAERKK